MLLLEKTENKSENLCNNKYGDLMTVTDETL